MCARRTRVDPLSKKSRSAVTNRSRVHASGDERTANARRFRDLIGAFSADLGDDISESDMALVRMAAILTLRAEQIQAEITAGEDIDPEVLTKLAGAARRSMQAISAKSLERKPATSMSFIEFAAQRAAELAAQADDDTDTDDENDEDQ